MKRFISLVAVIVLCFCLSVPAFAAEDDFVPSITYKPNPDVMTVSDEAGGEYFALIRDENGKVLEYIDEGCLLITPVAHIWDETKDVPENVEDLLSFVYTELEDDTMKLPYEKFGEDVDPSKMVIRDLFDIRWYCEESEEHDAMLLPKGVTLEITFDLGVMPNVPIYTMTYDEENKEWHPIVKTTNNGDGTVTCIFEHLCAVTFSMPIAADAGSASAGVEGAENLSVMPWLIAMGVATAGAAGLLITKKRDNVA